MPTAPLGTGLRFLAGHATHPDGHMALALAAAQVEADRAERPGFEPTLGLLYLSDTLVAQAPALLDEARQRWPGAQWAGTVGIGVAACGVEYFDEPAVVLWLCNLPAAEFRLFGGRQPLDWDLAWTALVHAGPDTPDLAEMVHEAAARTGAGYLFGGLASSRGVSLQWADEVFHGGLSGVAFSRAVRVVSRVTQGCQPLGPTRTVTHADGPLVLALDDAPALPQLLGDLGGLTLEPPGPAVQRLRVTLAGVTDAGDTARGPGGQFGADTRVRHLIGVDPRRQAVALAGPVEAGQQLAFCQRDAQAARRDLVRLCAEAREAVETDDEGNDSGWRVAAAHYVSCTGRGGRHFGGPSAELQIIRHALGDVPLAGFFAAGEIARHHLYGYTGVLTLFAVEQGG